jgi:shikimate kinase
MNLIEGKIVSDKTISIDLDKFISGESKVLVIAGLSGSGKSSLCSKLAKKYNAQCLETDECIVKMGKWDEMSKKNLQGNELKPLYRQVWKECVYPEIRKGRRLVMEGGSLWQGYILLNEIRKVAKNFPTIILGSSALKSSWRAWKRGRKGKRGYRIRKIPMIYRRNFDILYKMMNEFREKRLQDGGQIAEYKLPPFKGGVTESVTNKLLDLYS